MLTTNVEYEQWKDYMASYDNQRKNMLYDYGVPKKISHNLVKTKEVEYNPVLSKFVDDMRETKTKADIQRPLNVKKDKKQVITEKYNQPFDIITLEKNPRKDAPGEKVGKRRLQPKAQLDYNILNNNELDMMHWQGLDKPEPKKEYKKNINMAVFRDYNIINNQYWENQKEKSKMDKAVNKEIVDKKFWKVHDFNP